MSASYTNFAPGSQGDAYYFFAEDATFVDIVTINGTVGPIFNFTISGNFAASNIDYANWAVGLWLSPCLNTLCFGPLTAGGTVPPVNGNFSLDTKYIFQGSRQYQLQIQLGARVCMWVCYSISGPPAGTDMSGTADYDHTLTLNSVTLAAGETMIGQSGIDYGNLHPVPEPSSLALLFAGLAGLVRSSRRSRR